jgi:hypothetical protein
MQHQDKYVPADTNGGWPVAMGILALTAALIVTVVVIHRKTYKSPTDVTFHVKGNQP